MISDIDYFAARAPTGVPDWFEGPTTPAPTRPDISLVSGPLRAMAQDWLNGEMERDPPELTEFIAACKLYREKKKLWEDQCKVLRQASWAYYYACAMMDVRKSIGATLERFELQRHP